MVAQYSYKLQVVGSSPAHPIIFFLGITFCSFPQTRDVEKQLINNKRVNMTDMHRLSSTNVQRRLQSDDQRVYPT